MRRIPLAVAVAVLVAPATASAASWRAPIVLSSDGAGSSGSPTTPTVAVDGGGGAIAGWTPVADGVVKLRRAAAAPPSRPWTARKGSVSAGREQATAATAIERLETWADVTDAYTAETSVLVRLTDARGTTGKPRTLATQRGLVALRAAGEPGGRFAVAWAEKRKAVDALVVHLRGAAGGWTAVDVPAPSGFAHVTGLALALGNGGALALAATGNDRVVRAAVRSASGDWSGWQEVSGALGQAPQIAFARPAAFVVAWTRIVSSTRLAVEAAASRPDGSFDVRKTLDPGAARGPVGLTSSGSGDAELVWAAKGASARDGRVRFATRSSAGRWSAAATIAADSSERLSDPRLAALSNGVLVAAWRRGGGPAGYVQGAVRPRGKPWGAAQRVSPPGGGAIGTFALGGGGRVAHVVWDAFVAGAKTWRVSASRIRP